VIKAAPVFRGATTPHRPHFNRFQKDTPALAAPRSSQQNRGFLRREDYYTRGKLATKKCEKQAFLLVEINIPKSMHDVTASQFARSLMPHGDWTQRKCSA